MGEKTQRVCGGPDKIKAAVRRKEDAWKGVLAAMMKRQKKDGSIWRVEEKG